LLCPDVPSEVGGIGVNGSLRSVLARATSHQMHLVPLLPIGCAFSMCFCSRGISLGPPSNTKSQSLIQNGINSSSSLETALSIPT
jgi:hypothetical protein